LDRFWSWSLQFFSVAFLCSPRIWTVNVCNPYLYQTSKIKTENPLPSPCERNEIERRRVFSARGACSYSVLSFTSIARDLLLFIYLYAHSSHLRPHSNCYPTLIGCERAMRCFRLIFKRDTILFLLCQRAIFFSSNCALEFHY
jgi:hypothetical protein